VQPLFETILDDQRAMIFKSLEAGDGQSIEGMIALFDDDLEEAITETYLMAGIELGKRIVVEKREAEDPLANAILEEMDILREKSLIQDSTVEQINNQLQEGIKGGWNIADLQQSIYDAGIFDPVRALRIARTITGAGGSQGQWLAGLLVGATHKVWRTAGDSNVRERHQAMEGQEVEINERFSNGGRYPCDPLLSAADRINCRCSMSMIMKDAA
jgi:uncharacterized protein with gpF-like domain